MVSLVEQIQGSRLSRLYAWTSMHDLCLVQTPASYPYDGPYLRIAPKFDGTVELTYVDTGVPNRQWRRGVPDGSVFERLDRLTRELHWFPR
jgi:hypothetical protein